MRNRNSCHVTDKTRFNRVTVVVVSRLVVGLPLLPASGKEPLEAGAPRQVRIFRQQDVVLCFDQVRDHPGLLLQLVAALPVAVGEVRLEVALLPVKKTAHGLSLRPRRPGGGEIVLAPLKLCRLAPLVTWCLYFKSFLR